MGEAGAETGEETCGEEAYTLSLNEEAEGEATAPTLLPVPQRTKGSTVCVRFGGAGRDEDRLNTFVMDT